MKNNETRIQGVGLCICSRDARNFTYFLIDKPENVQFTTRTLKPKNGDRVTLSCSANGMPTPNFRIYKMTGSSRRLMSNGGTHTFYSINYADYPGFKATFRCESYNNVGTTTKDIEIEIQGIVTKLPLP